MLLSIEAACIMIIINYYINSCNIYSPHKIVISVIFIYSGGHGDNIFYHSRDISHFLP